MNLEEIFEDIGKIIEAFPKDIEDELMEALDFLMYAVYRSQGLPIWFKSFLANTIGRQFVWIFKKAGQDTTVVRTGICMMAIQLFGLEITWRPKWPLEQPA